MARTPSKTSVEHHTADVPGLPMAAEAANEMHARSVAIIERYGDGLPYERNRYVDKCRYHMMRSAEEALEVGRALIVMKEHELHGEFLGCVESLGIEYTVATRMMKAAMKFSNLATSQHLIEAAKTKSKLFELMLLDDEDLTELQAGGSVAGVTMDEISRATTSELRAMIRKIKADHAQQIADLKGDLDAKAKLIAAKNEKIDELATKLERKQDEPPLLTTIKYIDDLHHETMAIATRIQASLVARFTAVIEAHGDEGNAHARLLVAQSLGQIVSAARTVAAEFDVLPAEDAPSIFREAAGDDDREIWAKINADLAEQNDQAGTVN
ncbi:hypothetical protein ACR2R6_12860 [Methylocaldum gracile subsp. desertum]|uniref:hypothetical protein n=1 Tax=Methylocaldum sp. GT1BW TaxID=3438964 RepID=UPI003DA08376